jgi:hypothetical protein
MIDAMKALAKAPDLILILRIVLEKESVMWMNLVVVFL